MFVKALLATLVLASSTLGLASPQIHKRDLHNRHAHMVARSPIPVLRSADVINPLRRRHQRTKRCQNRPQTPDAVAAAAAPVNVEAVNSTPAQPQQQPPKADPPASSDPSPPAQQDPPSAPAPAPPSGGSYGQTMTGDGTYYDPGLGACGIVNTVTDYIVAVSYKVFDNYPGATANPNLNPICGKVVIATFNGKSVPVTITDRCAGCNGEGDLDFTLSAFTQIGDQAVGRLHGVSWQYPL